MLGRIISTVAGGAIARSVGGAASGPTGALIGAALPTVLRRFGPMGMIAAAVGVYAFGKFTMRQSAAATAKAVGASPQGGVTSTSSLPKLPPV